MTTEATTSTAADQDEAPAWGDDDEFDVESDTGAFAAIPLRVLTILKDARALQCYVVLVAMSDVRGYCRPSHATLGKKMGCSARTVQRAIDELRAKGLVKRRHRRRPDKDKGQTSNLYQVVRHVKNPGTVRSDTSVMGGGHGSRGGVDTGVVPRTRTSEQEPPKSPTATDTRSAEGPTDDHLRSVCSACGARYATVSELCDHQEVCEVLNAGPDLTEVDRRNLHRIFGEEVAS